MEVHPLSPRKSLGLQIPAGAAVESASINLKTPDMKWAKLFISMDGKGWTEVPLKADGSAEIGGVVKGVKLVNAGSPRGGDAGRVQAQTLANKGKKDGNSGAAGDFNLATFLPWSCPRSGWRFPALLRGRIRPSSCRTAGKLPFRLAARMAAGFPWAVWQGEKSDHLEFEVRQEAGQGYRPYGQEGYFREYF